MEFAGNIVSRMNEYVSVCVCYSEMRTIFVSFYFLIEHGRNYSFATFRVIALPSNEFRYFTFRAITSLTFYFHVGEDGN